MRLPVSVTHSACWMNIHTMNIHYCTDGLCSFDQWHIWIVSSSCLLWGQLLWAAKYRPLCGHVFSLLGVNTLAVGLLDHVVSVHFTLWKKKTGQTVLLEWLYMILAYNKGRKEKKYTLLFRKKKKKNQPLKKGFPRGKSSLELTVGCVSACYAFPGTTKSSADGILTSAN